MTATPTLPTTINTVRLHRHMLEGAEKRGAAHVLLNTRDLRIILSEHDRGWQEAERLAKIKHRRPKRQNGVSNG